MMSFKLFSVIGIALLLLSGCTTTTVSSDKEAMEPSTYTGSYVKRPTLVVSDIDKSIILFRDVLGFKLSRFDQDTSDSYVYPAFNIAQGTKVMHATFDTDDEKRVVSIVEVESMPRRPASALRTSAVLVNANGRLDEILTILKDKNYEILPKGKLGKTGTEVGFLDSNGHLIVLYEFPKP